VRCLYWFSISPRKVGDVFGIFKHTAPGLAAAFPTELNNQTGNSLREIGHEFGSTTDAPQMRMARPSCTEICYNDQWRHKTFMTKADVLSGFNTLQVCTSYKIDGKECAEFHSTPIQLSNQFIRKCQAGRKNYRNQGLYKLLQHLSDMSDLLKNRQVFCHHGLSRTDRKTHIQKIGIITF